MKVVSSKKEKKKTAACNFQTMAMNSFVITVITHDLMRGQMGTYAYTQTLSYS